MKLRPHILLLFLVLMLALSVRLFQIQSNPPHLNWDEVSIGYNAYSVLKTGRDEWGSVLPTIFRAYGDYKLPIYLYASIPPIFLFGLNTFSVRFVSVISGVASVFFTYLLAKHIFKKERVALISALLLAVEPWDLFLSRIALEANLALSLVISGMYFLFKSMEEKKKVSFLISSLLLGLSVWTYNSARVFVPMLVFVTYAFYHRELISQYKKYTAGFIVLLIFLIPMFWQLAHSSGSARYENVKIIDKGAIGYIIQKRQESTLPESITKVLYNRPVYFTEHFVKNYASHYSLDYLFKDGGNHYQFNIPHTGLLFSVNTVFILLGIVYLCFKKDKYSYILLSWFLLSPFASSLTREAPHALRNIIFLPTPMILSAVGIDFVANNFEKYKKILFTLYFSLLFLFSLSYLNNYFNSYRHDYSWAWQYGYSQAADYISDHYSEYNKIIFTKKYGEPHEFLLFSGVENNQPWAEPDSYQHDPHLNRFYQSNWYWVDQFDKFYFVNDWEIPKTNEQPFVLESGNEINLSGRVLFVTSPGNYPIRFVKLETISFLDGNPAFDIVTADF